MRHRRDWARKPCLRCGGPKPPGRGVKYCCAHELTLAELIEAQREDMLFGSRVTWERQRFGHTSRTRARTVSLDALPDEAAPCDEWDDPTFEEVWQRGFEIDAYA